MSGEIPNFWQYELNIFNKDGECSAELKTDGTQMQRHILADVKANADEISIIYKAMGEEAGFGSDGEKGDVLFKLRWKEKESCDAGIITTWEKLSPV